MKNLLSDVRQLGLLIRQSERFLWMLDVDAQCGCSTQILNVDARCRCPMWMLNLIGSFGGNDGAK